MVQGLAIAKEICDRNGWEMRYGIEDGLHLFTISKSRNSPKSPE
ncbi:MULTISPECIES: hypothetical protein [Chitinophagaceae]